MEIRTDLKVADLDTVAIALRKQKEILENCKPYGSRQEFKGAMTQICVQSDIILTTLAKEA